MPIIQAKQLVVRYGDHIVIQDLDFSVRKGEILSIIGPNGCGKSTLLKVLSRLLQPSGGLAFLDQKDIHSFSQKDLAKKVALLLQCNSVPEDMTVRNLIYYGRLPHKKWFEPRCEDDDLKIEDALRATDLCALSEKKIAALSGGERQRVWLAVALAQEPEILLLDEPTTYLDIGYQLELLELVRRLNHEMGLTVIMVLHDLNQAARYSDRLLVIKNKVLYACGRAEEVLTRRMLSEVYGVEADIVTLGNGDRVVVPILSIRSRERPAS